MNRPNIRQNNTTIKLVFKLIDAVAIGIGLILMLKLFPQLNSKATVASYLIALGIFSLAAELFGLYRNWSGIQFVREATSGIMTWGSTLASLFVLGTLSQYTTEFSSVALFFWFGITPLISFTIRLISRWVVAYMVKNDILSLIHI